MQRGVGADEEVRKDSHGGAAFFDSPTPRQVALEHLPSKQRTLATGRNEFDSEIVQKLFSFTASECRSNLRDHALAHNQRPFSQCAPKGPLRSISEAASHQQV